MSAPSSDAIESPAQSGYDAAACRALMRGGSKTFFAASLLLPARVRAPASALYAYCRLADDAIDQGADPRAQVRALQNRLDAVYRGRPGDEPADRALAQVVHGFGLPRALLDALLEGFLWDTEGRRYHTLSEVLAYGARVAGTVGAMMSLLMGARSPSALARACELGVAMQLTNIARDVGEDARNGRLYLPRDWLAQAGVDADAWLAAPRFTPAIGSVVQRLLAQADVLYRRSALGIAELPRDCRPAIDAARNVYAEIGRQLERDGLDSVTRRAVVPGRRKLVLVAFSTRALLLPVAQGRSPEPLPEIAFLVDAACAEPGSTRASAVSAVPRRSFDERMIWATDLFARLAEQDRRSGR
jgi:phytoene synthase